MELNLQATNIRPQFDPETVVSYYNNPFTITNEKEYRLAYEAHCHAQRSWLMAVADYHECPSDYEAQRLFNCTNRRTVVANHILEWEKDN